MKRVLKDQRVAEVFRAFRGSQDLQVPLELQEREDHRVPKALMATPAAMALLELLEFLVPQVAVAHPALPDSRE